jgi:hypothetical protein
MDSANKTAQQGREVPASRETALAVPIRSPLSVWEPQARITIALALLAAGITGGAGESRQGPDSREGDHPRISAALWSRLAARNLYPGERWGYPAGRALASSP